MGEQHHEELAGGGGDGWDADTGGKPSHLAALLEQLKMRGAQVDKDVVRVGGQAEISGRHSGHGFVGSLGQADLDPPGCWAITDSTEAAPHYCPGT